MLDRLKELGREARAALQSAADVVELENVRVKYLGRKSELTQVSRGLKDLESDERRSVGKKYRCFASIFMDRKGECLQLLHECYSREPGHKKR